MNKRKSATLPLYYLWTHHKYVGRSGVPECLVMISGGSFLNTIAFFFYMSFIVQNKILSSYYHCKSGILSQRPPWRLWRAPTASARSHIMVAALVRVVGLALTAVLITS